MSLRKLNIKTDYHVYIGGFKYFISFYSSDDVAPQQPNVAYSGGAKREGRVVLQPTPPPSHRWFHFVLSIDDCYHKRIISALLNHSLPMSSKICSQDENATGLGTAKTILPTTKNIPLPSTCPPPFI